MNERVSSRCLVCFEIYSSMALANIESTLYCAIQRDRRSTAQRLCTLSNILE